MEENVENNKFGFFKRVKTAIFKLEDYGIFVSEKPSVAFKYFFTLVFFSVLLIALVSAYDFFGLSSTLVDYVENELPEFTLQDGILHFEKFVEGYDLKYDFRLIINTFDVGEEDLKDYNNRLKTSGTGVLMLKDKFIVYSGGSQTIEYKYQDVLSTYGINISNKSDIINAIGGNAKFSLTLIYFIFNFIVLYIVNVLTILSDICLVAIVGKMIAWLCRMNVKMIGTIELAIYSLTLSVLLSAIYSCVNLLTDAFRIEYFNLIYLLIAYVYLVAALFMIRDDLIKQKEELERIYEVQAEVRKELENKEEKNEDEEDKEDTPIDKEPTEDKNGEDEETPDINNNEPDGSEI